MEKVEQQIECSTCQWNKMCIEPPSMTTEEIEQTKQEIAAKAEGDSEGKLFGSLLTAMVFGGRDKQCSACPVFISKLRESAELSNRIKEIMNH